MHGAHDFLQALTIVLCVAAVTTVVFGRLKQPVVLGYILAGLLIGPHLPVKSPLVADQRIVQTLSELGVILLMFSIGLEFSLRKFVRVAPTSGLTAVVQTSLMMIIGFSVGRLLGWRMQESLFAGAMIAFGSTTIVARVFGEQKIRGPLRDRVMGILIAQDLIAVVAMAALTAVSRGRGLSASELMVTSSKLGVFLVGVVAVGLLVVPRVVRWVLRADQADSTVIASVGICFGISLLAQDFGYSVALGAFIAGALVAESGRQHTIEHLVQPIRDLFGAVFFVSVGMMIDPDLIARHWPAVLVLTGVVLVGQTLTVSLGAFLTGAGVRTSVQAGMSLAQIGEFAFIIAALGLSLDATRPFLYPVAVAVSALTTLTTPLLIRTSGRASELFERRLPPWLQTFASLYGSWLEQLREAGTQGTTAATVRKLLRLMLLDLAALAVLAIGGSVSLGTAARHLAKLTGLSPSDARIVVGAVLFTVLAPFIWGVMRIARRLADRLAQAAFPTAAAGKADLANAPRRVLAITLQLALVLLAGAPLVVVTAPFLPRGLGALSLIALVVVLVVGFWRSAHNLQGHVRAGAELVAQALAQQAQQRKDEKEEQLAQLRKLLPGMGDPTPVEIEGSSACSGKSLAELNLRGATGATVLAIIRGGHGITFPAATEVLRPGDVVALAGSHDALNSARALLARPLEKAS